MPEFSSSLELLSKTLSCGDKRWTFQAFILWHLPYKTTLSNICEQTILLHENKYNSKIELFSQVNLIKDDNKNRWKKQ